MPLSARKELLLMQRRIFRQNQKLIRESVSIQESGFKKYEKTYKRHIRRYQAISPISEMMEATLKSDIVYVGDYHTCKQSQRSFLRILKNIIKKDKNFIIGLEFLNQQHQKSLDQFLNSTITKEVFLKKVQLKRHWVFDLWENFEPIFDFAKHHQIPLFAIDATNKKATLAQRDKAVAKRIADLLKKNPGQRIFVFIGDLHIAPPHLPKEIKKELKKMGLKKTELFLYQNSEAIYWKLAEKGEENAEVVRLNPQSFCRMNTPPVMLQRSYLNWLEHEEGEIDFADARHAFLEIVDRISGFLRIRLGADKEKVEVYTSGDLSFLDRIHQSKRFSKEEIRIIKSQILSSESYYIPKLHLVYLGNISLNHTAEEGAHFIKHLLSGVEKPRHPFDAFYANTLHEALGFFGSKIINHKRKCYHAHDYLKFIQFCQTQADISQYQLGYETALFAYEAKKLESKGEAISEMSVFAGRYDLFFALTHALGYMLGDKLYYALLSGVLKKTEISHLFEDPWDGTGKPFETYWRLITITKEVIIPKRM